MSDDWDFYFCQVDNHPASIFVDLGIAQEAPIAGFTVMAYVRVYMRAPRNDGLSSQTEFETLNSLEDALASLQSNSSAHYVGRNTSNGCRDLYFYVHTASNWQDRVAGVMQAFPTYEFESGTRDDPDWDTYFEFLYPAEEDQERIQNRRTCESLERNGDALEKERPIEHWIYFPDAISRKSFLETVAELGYATEEMIEPESKEDMYGVRLSCIGVPSIDNIDYITLPLYRAAKDHGGNYDGWETQVVR